MQLNCLIRSILDVVLCLEMIRYFVALQVMIFLSSHSCNAFLRLSTYLCQVEDLSRIYRLYNKIPKGLEPVSSVFKQVS